MKNFLTLARLLSAVVLLAMPSLGFAQSTVVISQVYPGGGSAAMGTSYTRDYVELFNRSASTVNIGGWSLQYASAAGASVSGNLAITAGTAIPAGGHYLIVTGAAGAAGVAVPGGDLVASTSGTPSLAAAGGKLFLATSATTVTFGTGASFGGALSGNVADAVGYGTAASYDGSAVAPAPANNGAVLVRAGNGCTDTNNNGADFASATTAANPPRNSSSPLAPCNAAPTAAEINVQQAGTTYLTSSTYSGFAGTAVGSSSTKTFTIQNTGGTALAVTGIALSGTNASDYSLTAPASPVAANGSATFDVTFTPGAAGARPAVLTITNADSDEGSYVINLTNTLPNPLIDITQGATAYASGSTYSGFPNTVVSSTSAATTFTISNSSTTDALTITGITTAGDFALSGTAPATVAAGGTATFGVTFTPTATGTRTGAVTVANSSTANASYVINLSGVGTNSTPVLTSAAPTSLLVGISSPVVLAGTTLSGSAVNFNGSTLTPSANSATSITVRIAAPSAATFPVTVTNTSGTSNALNVTAVNPPAGFFEPFEAVTQSGYVTAAGTSLALTSGSWTLFQGLITNSDAGDRKNNAQSVRLRGGGFIQMNADKTGGAGVVSLYAATYGSDTAPSFTLSYSTDGGMTYVPVSGTPAAGSLATSLTQYTYTLNLTGPVRLRIGTTNTTAGANPRINIDDVQIADYAPVGDLTVSSLGQNISGTYNNVTITGAGSATLTGALTVNTALTIQNGGALNTNCQAITGAGTFTVAAGATLQICDAAGITASGATGAVRVAGARSFSPDASYRYSGATAQVTGNGLPSQVRDLIVDNTAGLSLTGPLEISKRVNLSNGILHTNNQLTLLSSATGTALIARSAATDVAGNVTVQRYIDPSLNAGLGYRHYSSPVVSTAFNDLTTAGFSPEMSLAYNTSPTPGTITPFPNVYGYDEQRVATATSNFSAFDKGWFVPSGNLEQGRGYTVNIAASQKVDFTGAVTFANVNKTLTRAAGPDGGYHLLGNPYTRPLDLSNITIPAGINSAVYVFQSTSQYGGTYRTFVNSVGSPEQIIPIGQAFFVRANTNGAVFPMTYNNTTDSFDPANDVFHRSTPKPQVQLTLRNAANTLADDAYVYFEAGATAGFDTRFDAEKLPNTTGLNLASSAGSQPLAINALPTLTAATIVPLMVETPAAGAHVLETAQLTNLPAGTVVLLRDGLLGTRTVLTIGSRYAFALTGATAPGRFALEFQPAAAPLATASQVLAAQVQLYPNPAQGHFHLTLPAKVGHATATLNNAVGQVLLSRTLTTNEADFEVRTPGIYTLRVVLDGATITRKLVVE